MSAVGCDTRGVDGRFNAKTGSAVLKLQKQAKLDLDGIVGPKT